MNLGAIWMGPWVVGLACRLEAHKEQALIGLCTHGHPTPLIKGYMVFLKYQRADINRLYV